MPLSNRLAKNLSGTRLIARAVNIGEDADTVPGFINPLVSSPTFRIPHDTRRYATRYATQAWTMSGLPVPHLIGRQGRIFHSAVGRCKLDRPEIEAHVRNELNQ